MNNEQAARLAGVQAATRYVTSVSGSEKDIFLLASDIAHFILTGETVREPQVPSGSQESTVQSAQEQATDPREATVLAFANRAHNATSREEVEKITEEVKAAKVGDGFLSVQGRRVDLLEYLRQCWHRHPFVPPKKEIQLPVQEQEHHVIDPTRTDLPVGKPRDETARNDLGLG